MKLALNDVPIVSWCQYFNYGKRKEMNFLVALLHAVNHSGGYQSVLPVRLKVNPNGDWSSVLIITAEILLIIILVIIIIPITIN